MIALALDGPFNGQYLSDLSAKATGYQLLEWPNGEEVWMQAPERFVEPQEFSQATFNENQGVFEFDD